MDYNSVPQDESTRGGRQAAADEVNLRSRYGDAKVMKHSPYHNKKPVTRYMDATSSSLKDRTGGTQRPDPTSAVSNPDRINRMIDAIWDKL